jgi:hypothetical protein
LVTKLFHVLPNMLLCLGTSGPRVQRVATTLTGHYHRAGIRFFLQVAVNDVQIYGGYLEQMERIANL